LHDLSTVFQQVKPVVSCPDWGLSAILWRETNLRFEKRWQKHVLRHEVYAPTTQLTAYVSQKHPLVIGVSATWHDEKRFLAKLLDIDRYQDKKRYDGLVVIKPKAHELEKTKGRERYIFVYPRRLSPTPKSPQYRVNDQMAAIQIVHGHNLKTKNDWRGLAFFDSINDLRQFRHNYDDSGGKIQWYRGQDVTGQELPPC
jgi:hypothetical protein